MTNNGINKSCLQRWAEFLKCILGSNHSPLQHTECSLLTATLSWHLEQTGLFFMQNSWRFWNLEELTGNERISWVWNTHRWRSVPCPLGEFPWEKWGWGGGGVSGFRWICQCRKRGRRSQRATQIFGKSLWVACVTTPIVNRKEKRMMKYKSDNKNPGSTHLANVF